MPSKPCLEPDCPTLIPAGQGSRCPRHQQPRPSTSQRGYGTEHQQLRANLIVVYQPTDPCWRCRQPLGDNPSLLDLGHTDDRFGYMGLEHRDCNRGRRSPNAEGGGTGRRRIDSAGP